MEERYLSPTDIHRAANHAWYLRNAERLKAKYRAYRAAHLTECAAVAARWRAEHPEAVRKTTACKWRTAGIINPDGSPFLPVDYDRLYQMQSGKCFGCKKHSSDLKVPLAADHDHSTKIIRGLLCISCNLVLGNARDNAATLRNLITYLAKES